MISPIPTIFTGLAGGSGDSPDRLAPSPFATPPSIEAALARDPAAPQPQGNSSLVTPHSSLAGAAPAASASAVARFRQALALHEDLAAEAAAAHQLDLSLVTRHSSLAEAAPAQQLDSSLFTRHPSLTEASAAQQIDSSLVIRHSSLAEADPAASAPVVTRETLAAAASSALAQAAAFSDSVAAIPPAPTTTPFPEGSEGIAPAAPAPAPAPTIAQLPGGSGGVAPRPLQAPAPTAPSLVESVPSTSIAATPAPAGSTDAAPLAAAAAGTLARAAAFEASAATLTTVTFPLLTAATTPVASAPDSVQSVPISSSAPVPHPVESVPIAAVPASIAPAPHAVESVPTPVVSAPAAPAPASAPTIDPLPGGSGGIAPRPLQASAPAAPHLVESVPSTAIPSPARRTDAAPLAAAAAGTLAQAALFEASAATLTTAALPLLSAATTPVVPAQSSMQSVPIASAAPAPHQVESVPTTTAPVSIAPAPHAVESVPTPVVSAPAASVVSAPAAPAPAPAPTTNPLSGGAGGTPRPLQVPAPTAPSLVESVPIASIATTPAPTRRADAAPLAAAAAGTLAQAAAFEASAATLTTAAFPLLTAATTPVAPAYPPVQSVPIATAAPVPHPVESVPTATAPASIAPAPHTVESVPTPVVAAAPSFSSPHAMISPMPPSSPASAPEPTPETLATAASATMAQAASFEASVAQFASSPIVSSPLSAPVEKPVPISATPAPVSPTAVPVDAASKIPVSPTEANLMAPVAMFTATDGTTIPYRAYIPAPAQPESAQTTTPAVQFPLVLFMHGAGTRGSDGVAIADNISFRSLLGWVKNHEPAIVLAPQCPADEKWVDTPWGDVRHTYSPVPPPHTAAALELLDKALASLPVDRSRILVCGNSMGGYASWDLLVRRPGLFAAALPVCGGGVPDLTAETSRDVAIWAFHGDADPAVPVENTRGMVEALRADPARTAEIRYREYPGVSHDSWTPTFTDPEVLSWFFAQHRAGPAAPAVTRETLAAEASAALLRATALSDSATAFAVTAQPVLAAASNDGQAVLGQPAPTSATPVPQAPAPEPAPALATSPTSADPVPTAPVPGSVPPSAPDAEDIAAAIQAAPLPASPQVDSSLVTRHSSLAEAVSPASIVRAAFEPAVEAVAEAIQISPDIATKGEGEIRIQLKPAVLDGSTVQISVDGNDMSIVFTPATPDAAALLQAHTPELATLLAERVPAWRTSVAVAGTNGRRDRD